MVAPRSVILLTVTSAREITSLPSVMVALNVSPILAVSGAFTSSVGAVLLSGAGADGAETAGGVLVVVGWTAALPPQAPIPNARAMPMPVMMMPCFLMLLRFPLLS